MDYTGIDLEQEDREIEAAMTQIRLLIVSEVNREHCSLTELAKKVMRLKLTTQSILTTKEWLDDTKDVILFELTKMDRYCYSFSDDQIHYNR